MLLIINGRVATRDAENRFFPRGAVATDGDTIIAVGEEAELKAAYPQAELVDARGGLIMPALINSHHHIYSALSRGMRQRIFYEASLSLALADRLSEALKEKGVNDMPVEIHLDVGTHGDTRELVREVTGMITGSGFDARIKPDACAASKVADKYTK